MQHLLSEEPIIYCLWILGGKYGVAKLGRSKIKCEIGDIGDIIMHRTPEFVQFQNKTIKYVARSQARIRTSNTEGKVKKIICVELWGFCTTLQKACIPFPER